MYDVCHLYNRNYFLTYLQTFGRSHITSIHTYIIQFGDEVYDIFSTSKDQNELESKIVAAYDKVHEAFKRDVNMLRNRLRLVDWNIMNKLSMRGRLLIEDPQR